MELICPLESSGANIINLAEDTPSSPIQPKSNSQILSQQICGDVIRKGKRIAEARGNGKLVWENRKLSVKRMLTGASLITVGTVPLFSAIAIKNPTLTFGCSITAAEMFNRLLVPKYVDLGNRKKAVSEEIEDVRKSHLYLQNIELLERHYPTAAKKFLTDIDSGLLREKIGLSDLESMTLSELETSIQAAKVQRFKTKYKIRW